MEIMRTVEGKTLLGTFSQRNKGCFEHEFEEAQSFFHELGDNLSSNLEGGCHRAVFHKLYYLLTERWQTAHRKRHGYRSNNLGKNGVVRSGGLGWKNKTSRGSVCEQNEVGHFGRKKRGVKTKYSPRCTEEEKVRVL